MDNDTKFLEKAEAKLNWLEDHLMDLSDELDCARSGNVLTIELDDGQQIVVNIQTPMHEIWCASVFGGTHFKQNEEGQWINPRTKLTLEKTIYADLARFGLEL